MKKSFFYLIITAIVFSTLEPFGHLDALSGINWLSITAVRFLIGSALLLPFTIFEIKKRKLKISIKDFAFLGFLGILCVCISMNLLQFSIIAAKSVHISAANVAIIFCSNSLFTIILSAIFLGEKLTPMKILSVILCTVGLSFCIDFSLGGSLLSSLLALASALTFSVYTILSKRITKKLGGMVQTGISFSIGTVALIIVMACTGTNAFSAISTDNIAHLAYLGIAVTGIGYLSFFRCIELSSASFASYAFFIKPILTPFTVWLINGEAPTDWKLIVSIVLVVAGSIILTPLVPDFLTRKRTTKNDLPTT